MNEQTIEDAAAEGSKVADDWHGSVELLIRACVGIKNGVQAFGKDKALLDAFLAPLVKRNVLTADEARQGRSGSKLSMLVQIGEREQLLRHDDIAPRLKPGHTIVYQTCVLFKNLPGQNEAQKVEELARIMAECPDDGAREYLIAQTRKFKRAARAPEPVVIAPVSTEPPHEQTLGDLLQAGRRFGLMLLTPAAEDLRLLGADYPDLDVLERNLPLFQLIEQSAAVVITARITDLPLIANKLLPLCGFSRLTHVLLVRRPVSLDVIEAEALVTADRGDMRLSLPEDGAWLDEAGPINPLVVAEQLFPDAVNRLHVFAPAQADGWTCLVGGDAWVAKPSIR